MRQSPILSWLALPGLLAACSGAGPEPVTARASGVAFEVRTEPASPRIGANVLWIELRDAAGEALADAELDAKVHMHAMGAMPAMGGAASVEPAGDGRYRAAFDLEMGGTWNIELRARAPGRPPARVEGSLTVGVPGVRLAGTPAAAHGEPAMSEAHPAEFRLAPERRQRVGVKTAPAERKAWRSALRAVGRVVAEETTLEDVSLKIGGWVGEIRADALGEAVTRGETLFSVYSPELVAAQEEYLQALRSQQRAREGAVPERADYLVRAARNRLRRWDVAARDLDRLAARGEPFEQLPIRAATTGYVVEKNIVAGSAFEPGERLYRIAPLSRVWVEAEVYESELALVREGEAASVTLPYLPGRRFDATVAYVHPTLDPATRTARVRLELPNPELALRPEMYASVRIEIERGERLVVPQSAVLYAGERSFVFRDLGDGRLRPQPVEVGLRSGEEVEILSGLEPGAAIVTSGTFLVASESRLRAALEQW